MHAIVTHQTKTSIHTHYIHTYIYTVPPKTHRDNLLGTTGRRAASQSFHLQCKSDVSVPLLVVVVGVDNGPVASLDADLQLVIHLLTRVLAVCVYASVCVWYREGGEIKETVDNLWCVQQQQQGLVGL